MSSRSLIEIPGCLRGTATAMSKRVEVFREVAAWMVSTACSEACLAFYSRFVPV